jgi:molecular chaperone DnaK (HSP70)
MLKYFIRKSYKQTAFTTKPRVVICVPSGVTEVEKRAVIEAAISAGARERDAHLVEEPMAAAIGAGLQVEEPIGKMVVDIGGGTSEVAVISLGGIVTSLSLRVAGDELDEQIISYVKKKYNLAIGEHTAEVLKMEIACVYAPKTNVRREICGRDLVSGLPKSINISAREVYEAIIDPVNGIINAVKLTLEKTNSQSAISQIALNDREPEIRKLALKKSNSQSTISQVALNDREPEIRKFALEMSNSQSTISQIALNDRDPEIRKLALKRSNSQSTIKQIALNDRDPEIRKLAQQRLN